MLNCFIVHCLSSLFTAYCLLFTVYCSLFTVYRLPCFFTFYFILFTLYLCLLFFTKYELYECTNLLCISMYFCFFIVLCLLFIDVSLITQHDKKRLFIVIHGHSIVKLLYCLLFIVYCSPHPRPLSNWRGEWAFKGLFGILMVLQFISTYFYVFLCISVFLLFYVCCL